MFIILYKRFLPMLMWQGGGALFTQNSYYKQKLRFQIFLGKEVILYYRKH